MSDRRDGTPEAALDAEGAADSVDAAEGAESASPDGGHAAAATGFETRPTPGISTSTR